MRAVNVPLTHSGAFTSCMICSIILGCVHLARGESSHAAMVHFMRSWDIASVSSFPSVPYNSPSFSPVIGTAHGYENINQVIEMLCIKHWYSCRTWPDQCLCCYSIAALSLPILRSGCRREKRTRWVFNTPGLSSSPICPSSKRC